MKTRAWTEQTKDLMRLGHVIGRVTLSAAVPSVTGGRWLIVSPFSRADYALGQDVAPTVSKEPSLVIYDDLGAGVGQTVGFVEGREAAQPFNPPIPIDAVNAALVDKTFYHPFET